MLPIDEDSKAWCEAVAKKQVNPWNKEQGVMANVHRAFLSCHTRRLVAGCLTDGACPNSGLLELDQ
jgi:hypothetical protein